MGSSGKEKSSGEKFCITGATEKVEWKLGRDDAAKAHSRVKDDVKEHIGSVEGPHKLFKDTYAVLGSKLGLSFVEVAGMLEPLLSLARATTLASQSKETTAGQLAWVTESCLTELLFRLNEVGDKVEGKDKDKAVSRPTFSRKQKKSDEKNPVSTDLVLRVRELVSHSERFHPPPLQLKKNHHAAKGVVSAPSLIPGHSGRNHPAAAQLAAGSSGSGSGGAGQANPMRSTLDLHCDEATDRAMDMDVGGHLFVTLADIRSLACDAWLVPANRSGGFGLRPNSRSVSYNSNIYGTFEGRTRVRLWGDPRDFDSPVPWLTYVNPNSCSMRSERDEDKLMTWMLEGVRQFAERAVEHHKAHKQPPRNRRSKYLLALPHISTGSGGARHISGTVLKYLIPFLIDLARDVDVDIALVSVQKADFAAAQSIRSQCYRQRPETRNMTPLLFEEVQRLAEYALNDDLVLFLGAGISVGAGLPMWGQLLKKLGKVGGMTDEELNDLMKVNFLDQARIVESRLGGPDKLQQQVANHLRVPCFSISHSLLACLPVKAIVTTNYDDLFEKATQLPTGFREQARSLSVLPYETRTRKDRWLLKMHGCVNHPSDIVLTRSDYIRYADRRAALSGIVQSLLITKHMLFVGFSLNDDNFHRIMDAVRLAVPKDSPVRFGTTFTLHAQKLQEELWRSELKAVPMAGPEGSKSASIATAARRLEISLDILVGLTSSTSQFLLSRRFDGIFTKEEEEIRRAIVAMVNALPPNSRNASRVFPKVKQFLLEFSESSSW
eukprot:CAMPEP_0119126692 /NCGR_PEP_ID=MMETSP1310-20130426/5516_1 /TAXON_ID=464262 /ORGANISM="Genus nov. species nov., Strain RCC2339" /LENGTH=776 /DNA_ID=CAMNT_0007116863 /DNA_START=162 /DNA_END=2492 /DNA_ORIENTATION=+